jgi:hypothetical protein
VLILAAGVVMTAVSADVKADSLLIQSGGFSLDNLGNDGSVPNGLDSLVGFAESNSLQFNGSGVFTVNLNSLEFMEGFTGIASPGSYDFSFSQAITINGQTQIMDLLGRIEIGIKADTIHILSSTPLTFDFNTFTVDVNVLPMSIFGPGDGCYFDVLRAELSVNSCDPVPEPATLTLLGLGLAGTVAKVRQRRKQAALKRSQP